MKSDQIIYVYDGDGLGVPGLPREITQAQADADGCGELLKNAIDLGVYVEKTVKTTGKAK
jgi:hypothetical protein